MFSIGSKVLNKVKGRTGVITSEPLKRPAGIIYTVEPDYGIRLGSQLWFEKDCIIATKLGLLLYR